MLPTKPQIALFFICVKTNVGYSVVAEFVVQSETSENISEALLKLKEFMTDYSEAELMANNYFHKAWGRWVKDQV